MDHVWTFIAGLAVGTGGMLLLAIKELPDDGRIEDAHSVAKSSYDHGKETMRRAVIDKLEKAQAKVLGTQRRVLAEIIDMVRNLEV